MAEGAKTAESQITKEDSVEQNARYVLHGGYAYCECGSRASRLQVPYCHGTYMHDMPIMVDTDTLANTNIQPFGYCYCMENPDRQAAIDEIMKQVEEETHDLLDTVMDGVNAVGKGISGFFSKAKSFFCGEEEEGEEKKSEEDEYAEMLRNSVMVPCDPRAFSFRWNGASEDLIIQGRHALTTNCTITCAWCGKTIYIADDGQENAAYEQNNKQDLSNWKEGDPMPEPTAGNLQALKAMGKEDTELYKNMEQALKTMNDLDQRKLYCQSEEEYKALEKTREQVKEKYKNKDSYMDASDPDNAEAIQKRVDNPGSGDKDIYYNGKFYDSEGYKKKKEKEAEAAKAAEEKASGKK